MNKYPRFDDLDAGTPVFVNPWNVRLVRPADRGVEIVFDGDHTICVSGSADDVVKQLEKARRVW